MKKFRIILMILLVFSATLFFLQGQRPQTVISESKSVDVETVEPILSADINEAIEETRQQMLLADNDWKPVSPFAN